MAHFAQLDDNNKVLQVIVVANDVLLDNEGKEQEQIGVEFCKNLLGGKWIQTSYNNTFRKKYACIDDIYDVEKDGFKSPQPFPSWKFNETKWVWEAPVPMPDDVYFYVWNEKEQKWIKD